MCYLVVERYSVCRCLYYKHSVDMCAAYGTQGHPVEERTVLVGYACERHSGYQQQESSSQETYSDSGYNTASHGSHRHSSRRSRRWNILSSITGYSWQSRPLVRFEFEHWTQYLFSFRGRNSSAPPSQLTLLLVGHDRMMPRSAPWRSTTSPELNTSYIYILSRRTNGRTITRDAMILTKLSKAQWMDTKRVETHTHMNTHLGTQVFEICIA